MAGQQSNFNYEPKIEASAQQSRYSDKRVGEEQSKPGSDWNINVQEGPRPS